MDILDFRIRPLRDYLPEAVYREACRRAQRRKFRNGESLHSRGDPSPRLCIVAEGAVRIGRVRPDGSFNLVSVLGVGGHFGDIGLQNAANTHDSYADGDCEIFIINDTLLEDLLRNQPGFALGLWRCNTERLHTILELYDDLRTLGIVARLAKVIYIHCGRGEIDHGIACRQRDMAELLGVTEVSIGNALRVLESEGLIKKGYKSVHVVNESNLEDWLRRNNAL